MYLYFVRHGESEANLARVFSNVGYKHPLTPVGREQARALGERLAAQPIARIYTSPLMRAAQTAEILADILQAPIQVSDALREWSVGMFEGTSDEEGWRQHRLVQEDWFIHGRWESKIPGGESYLDMRERFVPFVEALIQQGRGADERVVLVGHGGLYQAMLPVVLGNVSVALVSQQPFPTPPTCWVRRARRAWCAWSGAEHPCGSRPWTSTVV